MLLEKRQLKN